jgi:hypothetical protein
MKRLFFLLIFIVSNAYAGFFGASNYEECVLEGLKDASNSTSAQLLHKVCKEKFKKEGAKNIVSECYLTWNGNTFTAGIPENIEKYTKITFQGSSDLLFIPTSLMGSVTQEFIFKEKKKIQSICPSIILK